MAREFIDSFEAQNLDLWDTVSGSSIESTAGLDMKGDYCAHNSGDFEYIEKELTDNNEYYFAYQWRPTKDTGNFLYLYKDTTELLYFQFPSSTHKIAVWMPSVNYLGTKTYPINNTYFMQIYIKIANSGGRILVKCNGIIDFDYTGDTLGAGESLINKIKFTDRGYFDNIVIDNSQMPEETKIVLLKPNAIGDLSNWVPSAGDNYACIDEVPYSDSDYVSASVVDTIDTYGLENLPSAAKSIKCVQAQARVRRDSDSIPIQANLVLRTNGSNYHGSDVSVTTNYECISHIWNDNPDDSQDFEKEDIDNLEIGIRSRS